ncbi:cyclic GMP-AMP synthase-like receptor isoform X1 [Plodia interpunctella]|uniref:cyclic GMP-AMP synthase-like receptor isoform X1 n=1 Tax=Plodia interpunctella TaxID=58824 RepID=UPI002367F6C0|nr:cyclic GMP-AMP synthase-like receptor isoform X1 [Plodia interpunctella]
MKTSKRNVTLEEVFLQINHDYVKIDKKEAKYNNVVLRFVLDEILNKMRECDSLFDSMKPKLDYLGSYYDGLRVGHPTEFDINVILKLPINYKKIKLDCTNTEYDYTNVIMPSEFRRLCKSTTTARKGFTKTELWCDNTHRLSVKKFRSWMQSVVDSALNKLPMSNGRHVLIVKNICYKLSAKLSGPANTITIHKTTNNIDVDLVPTFAFDLPKKPISSAVDFFREEFKNNSRYFIVPKPTKDEYLWRLTFPFQERACMRSKNNFKSAVKLIKLLRDTQRFDALASYYIKTLFLWETKKQNDKFWSQSLSSLVVYMLTLLRDHLANKEIKNYWCSENNLLDKLKEETCKNWANKLSYIIKDIEQKKNQNPYFILKYFTNGANHTHSREDKRY